MNSTIDTANYIMNKQCKFSSSVSKNGIFSNDGRSVSIFSINADDCKSMISPFR